MNVVPFPFQSTCGWIDSFQCSGCDAKKDRLPLSLLQFVSLKRRGLSQDGGAQFAETLCAGDIKGGV